MNYYSKRHYEDVARIFAQLNLEYGIHNAHDHKLIGEAMEKFSKLFKEDNPRFNILLFGAACQDTRRAK